MLANRPEPKVDLGSRERAPRAPRLVLLPAPPPIARKGRGPGDFERWNRWLRLGLLLALLMGVMGLLVSLFSEPEGGMASGRSSSARGVEEDSFLDLAAAWFATTGDGRRGGGRSRGNSP